MIIVHSQWLSFPDDHGYVPLIIVTVPSSLLLSSFITRFVAKSNTIDVTSRAGTADPSRDPNLFPLLFFCCCSCCAVQYVVYFYFFLSAIILSVL